jgi:hypothetical protein
LSFALNFMYHCGSSSGIGLASVVGVDGRLDVRVIILCHMSTALLIKVPGLHRVFAHR